jgi:putative DNA primase/helicase
VEGVGAPALSRRGIAWPPAQAANTTPIERDPQLFEKLKAEEWPGILSWMIQGYLEWKRSGLQPPDIVRNASEAYFQAEDSIATWIDEHCRLDPQAWEPTAKLYASWSA